jgi:hypothetical protein
MRLGGGDMIAYNAHRVYGPVQLPHLLANWKQVWKFPGKADDYEQLLLVLEK